MLKSVLLLAIMLYLQATNRSHGQTISLSVRNASLEKIFALIEKQTPWRFIYTRQELADAGPVSIRLRRASLQEALDHCLTGKLIEYEFRSPYVIVRKKQGPKEQPKLHVLPVVIQGQVLNTEGEPVAGATISTIPTGMATATDDKGYWKLEFTGSCLKISISSVGYNTKEIDISASLNIVLNRSVNILDETMLIAYGYTTRRFNLGGIGKLKAAEIEKTPVSNPLATLSGKIPGMIITQTSGVTGASFSVGIRGRSSIDPALAGNDPLILIDGVPFEAGNKGINQIPTAANNPVSVEEGGISALNTINSLDIESIEVLKDAEATAIYGSRGANGVIMISTKTGDPGKTRVKASLYTGYSKVTRMMDMLNTSQYVEMRREAFRNDGIIPSAANAADIVLWDTTRYTDMKNLFTGGTAYMADMHVSVSGGSKLTQVYTGIGYHYETNVFGPAFWNGRNSIRSNLSHQSKNEKFRLQVVAGYASDRNNLMRYDMTHFVATKPNTRLYDSAGNLNWIEKGINFANPLANYLKKHHSVNDNLQATAQLSYQINKTLSVSTNIGYNRFFSDEVSVEPKTSFSPTSSQLGLSYFADKAISNWIAEPQAEYKFIKDRSSLKALIGGSWQNRLEKSQYVSAFDYTNDLLLYDPEAAGTIRVRNNYQQYRYVAFFGRIGYTYRGRYMCNLNIRRDGSSRFGPDKRFSNFGAIAAGWIFSEESFFKKLFPFISFGKIRASYGVTGNDQVGDYQYLDLWNNTSTTYQGVVGYRPARLYNSTYNWERNQKMEAALEMGFAANMVLFNISYYMNRSSNLLITDRLSEITGFGMVRQNFQALVQNSGFEITLSAKSNPFRKVNWRGDLVITIPRNRLLSFPDQINSSYATSLVVGEPLNVINRYRYLGIDPATGAHLFDDTNRDGILNTKDYVVAGSTDPTCFGSVINHITCHKFELSVFFEFRRQTGKSYLAQFRSNFPGNSSNQPALVLKRWQKPGDITSVPKYSTSSSVTSRLGASSAMYTDASFGRLKNLSVSYTLFSGRSAKFVQSTRLFIHTQNILTLTSYQGADPETQNFYQLPPLKTIVMGAQITL